MNKPVAYGMLTFCKNCGEQNPYPVKELTDEEIEEVINRTAWVGTEDEIRFKIARAILRKAQEK